MLNSLPSKDIPEGVTPNFGLVEPPGPSTAKPVPGPYGPRHRRLFEEVGRGYVSASSWASHLRLAARPGRASLFVNLLLVAFRGSLRARGYLNLGNRGTVRRCRNREEQQKESEKEE